MNTTYALPDAELMRGVRNVLLAVTDISMPFISGLIILVEQQEQHLHLFGQVYTNHLLLRQQSQESNQKERQE